MTNAAILALAARHVDDATTMKSSAVLAYEDAVSLWNDRYETAARAAALRSLRYSVGILSPVYLRAAC